jgi:hypothetical protein
MKIKKTLTFGKLIIAVYVSVVYVYMIKLNYSEVDLPIIQQAFPYLLLVLNLLKPTGYVMQQV